MGSSEIDIAITNGQILTMNNQMEIIPNGYLLISKSKIIELGKMADLKKSSHYSPNDWRQQIDARNKIVLPGFINTHSHFAMTLFRGLADDLPLKKWLNDFIWPIEAKLRPEDCYIGSKLAAIEMISSGTTTACDMYFYEKEVMRALEEIGFRGILGYGMLDFDSEEKQKKELQVTEDLIKHCSEKGKLCDVIISPHAPNTCSAELLKEAKTLAKKYNKGLQIHLSETKSEVKEIKEKFNLTPTQYLKEINFLGENLLAAHCIWLNKKDIEILANYKVKIAHNPTSNLKLGSGIFNYAKLKEHNLTIGLGTDGASSNNTLSMLQEMRLASYLAKGKTLNPEQMPAEDALRIATIEGAKALNIDKKVGSLEKGKKADIIIINPKKPNTCPQHNPYSLIVYAACEKNIQTTIINGKIIMENQQFPNLNIEEIMNNATKATKQLLEKSKIKNYKKKINYLTK